LYYDCRGAHGSSAGGGGRYPRSADAWERTRRGGTRPDPATTGCLSITTIKAAALRGQPPDSRRDREVSALNLAGGGCWKTGTQPLPGRRHSGRVPASRLRPMAGGTLRWGQLATSAPGRMYVESASAPHAYSGAKPSWGGPHVQSAVQVENLHDSPYLTAIFVVDHLRPGAPGAAARGGGGGGWADTRSTTEMLHMGVACNVAGVKGHPHPVATGVVPRLPGRCCRGRASSLLVCAWSRSPSAWSETCVT